MKKNILLLFFILAGAMVGSLIASAGQPECPCSPGWLTVRPSAFPLPIPAYLDLAVVRVAFGLEMGLSIAQIGCIILSLFGYRWALKKI